MQELEKILDIAEINAIKDLIEENEQCYKTCEGCCNEVTRGKCNCKDALIINVIEKMKMHMNDGWIPVEQELPPNSKHKGALCPRYQVMTKYGVTEGWYNPDYESWYILCWFMGNDHLKHEIDFERGTFPKVVRCENSVNDKHGIVIAWRPLPEPYHPERSDNHDGE